MESIELSRVHSLSSPHPFAIVTSQNGRSTNLMALSWWTFTSNHPLSLVICTSNRGLTGELIRQHGEFGLCLVGEALQEAALQCGGCSGRTVDKAEAFHIPLTPAQTITPMLVQGSCLALECKLTQCLPAGDHTLYLAQVTAAHRDNQAGGALYAFDGYQTLRPLPGL